MCQTAARHSGTSIVPGVRSQTRNGGPGGRLIANSSDELRDAPGLKLPNYRVGALELMEADAVTRQVTSKPAPGPEAIGTGPQEPVQPHAQSEATTTPKIPVLDQGSSGKEAPPEPTVREDASTPAVQGAAPVEPLRREDSPVTIARPIPNLNGQGRSASTRAAMELNDRASSERAIRAIFDTVEGDLNANRNPGQENVVGRLMKLIWNQNNLGDLRNTAVMSGCKAKILEGLRAMFGADYAQLKIPKFLKN